MLPFNSLDTETFSQIVEKARKSINIYDPSWTDENYHDPGITFIELFAWLKEMQQFYLDRVNLGNFAKYIKLIGGSISHTSPSFVKADIIGQNFADEERPANELYVIPSGTRAYAGNVPFETINARYIGRGTSDKPGGISLISTDEFIFEIEEGKRIKCYPFGQDCLPSSAFTIHMNQPLAKGRQSQLEFEIFEDYQVKRAVISNGFFELAQLRWEYFTACGWVSVPVKDNTHRLARSGSIKLIPETDMVPMENNKYGLRCVIENASYDVAPLINSISLNTLQLRQIYTLSEEINIEDAQDIIEINTYLSIYGNQEIYRRKADEYVKVEISEKKPDAAYGTCSFYFSCTGKASYKIISYENGFAEKRNIGIANGFPYQVFEISLDGQTIYYDSFNLATVEMNAERNETLREWFKVEDFDASGKYDRHYTLDENTGKIVFGDGINGMCPKGKVVITQCALTYGRDGNIKRRQINMLHYAGRALLMRNDNHAYGGADKESYIDAMFRIRSDLGKPLRAVTKLDYENIVMNTPGLMIESVVSYCPDKHFINKHECSPNTVVIAVKPFSNKPNPKLSEVYVRNILANLEQYRLLGTEILIQSPKYIDIEIYVDVTIKEYYLDWQESMEQKIRHFFVREYSGFGTEIQYDSIYRILDASEAVKAISALIINAKGNNVTREDNGNIRLPANGLCCLNIIHFTVK